MASAFLLMLLSCGDEPGRVDSLETLTVNVKVPGTLIDNVKPEELVEAKCLIVRGDINCVDLAHIRNFGYAPDEHGNAPVKELLGVCPDVTSLTGKARNSESQRRMFCRDSDG